MTETVSGDRAAILSGVQSFSEEERRVAIEQLQAMGPDGDALLSEALRHDRLSMAFFVAYALGWLEGPYGTRALEELLDSRPKDTTLRSAAIYALGRRSGADATRFVAQFLDGRSRDDAWSAAAVLALYGDDSAWDIAFTRLGRRLGRERSDLDRNRTHPPTDVVVTIAYLARFTADSSTRCHELLSLLGRRWPNVTDDEREWLNDLWPDAAPATRPPSPRPPDAAALDAWIAQHLTGVQLH